METQQSLPFVLLLVHVAVNNIKVFIVALLIGYKTFGTAVSNIHVPTDVTKLEGVFRCWSGSALSYVDSALLMHNKRMCVMHDLFRTLSSLYE